MSLEHSERITCPKCGEESDFVIWQSINTMINPETKAKVLSGEIFRFKCPKCGMETDIMYDCLYHQMEDHIMIYVVYPDEFIAEAVKSFDSYENNDAMKEFKSVTSNYTFRIVRDQNQLREKVYIFNQGLDDRVIELMKVIIISHLAEIEPDLKVSYLLLNITDGAPEIFAVRSEDGQWSTFPFVQKTYDIIKTEVLDLNDDGKRSYFVNIEWAIDYLRSHSQN